MRGARPGLPRHPARIEPPACLLLRLRFPYVLELIAPTARRRAGGDDGFGNLTDQNVIAGTAPSYHTTFDTTSHGGCSDANGNTGANSSCAGLNTMNYDVSNRFVYTGYNLAGPPNYEYGYAPGNKRLWRGVWTSGTATTDEVVFWSVSGQKLATYQITEPQVGNPSNPPQ